MGGDKMESKLRKGHNIQKNWNCSVQDALPPEIRPRTSNRSKAPIGTLLSAAPWQSWSIDLLTELERLSSTTIGKLAFAQELMVLEVHQRQQDLNNRHHAVAEILRSDLQRINKDMAENSLTNLNADEESDGDMESEDEEDGDVDDLENGPDRPDDDLDEYEQAEAKVENDESDLTRDNGAEGNEKAVSKIGPGSSKMRTATPNGMSMAMLGSSVSYSVRKKQAKILRLRADAMRLKQEAAKRLAEAYELEAKMLMDSGN